ncbi:tyrosine-protein kinase receptor-like isoform X2 [Panulirus ornatus]|uniref:tyrosine-protein kinase receptor-like isoform X2 n=1 Tax=Panulirus ornatus TaxID=150431 RepID=UPI003A87FF95
MLRVYLRLVLTMLCGGAALAGSTQEARVICLDQLYPRVRTEYRLLKFPDDWTNHVPVDNDEVTTIDGARTGPEQRESHELNTSTFRVKNHSRTTEGKAKVMDQDKKQERQQHVLCLTYDFRVSVNETLDDDGGDDDDGDTEDKNNDSEHVRGREARSESYPQADDDGTKKGRGNVGDKAADLFSIDFLMESSEVLVPCWWLTLGSSNAYLTVALIGGDILEDSDSREEDIRQKYGDYTYLVFRAEERRVEREWRELFSNASGGTTVNELDMSEEEKTTPVDKAWRAVDELRRLWHSRSVAHFLPREADSSRRRPHVHKNSFEFSSQLNSGGRVRRRHVNKGKKDPNSYASSSTPDGRKPSSETRPYTDFYSPSNISDELFPGYLPPHLHNYHHRFPSSSSWHSFRHAVDYHMMHTGVVNTPLLTAATYQLPVGTCLKTPGEPGSTSESPSSHFSGRKSHARTLDTNDIIPIDFTPLLRTWLRETLPWKRETSKITVVMFTTDYNPRQQQTPEIRDKEPPMNEDSRLHQSRTLAEDSESFPPPVVDSTTGHATGPTTPTAGHHSQPSSSVVEGESEGALDQASLSHLLRHSPPHLFINYRLDESCRRRARSDPCEADDKADASCHCRIRSGCNNTCGLQCDFEEEGECAWEWQTDIPGDVPFRRVTGHELTSLIKNSTRGEMTGISADAEGNPNGHFLFLGVSQSSTNTNNTRQIKSPWLEESTEQCRLQADYNVWKRHDASTVIKVLIENGNYTSITNVADTFKLKFNKTTSEWKRMSSYIARITRPFRLGIEVILGNVKPTHVAIDNIKLVDCFDRHTGPCTGLRCETGECVLRDSVCDLIHDCPGGDDEALCESEPEGSRCDFENGMCGWTNIADNQMDFKRHRGPTERDRTGPPHDHTYKNSSGWYMLSELPYKGKMGDTGILESPYFDPPPCSHDNKDSQFYESCKVRMHYHKLGRNQGSMVIEVLEEDPKGRIHLLEQIHGNKREKWQRLVLQIPHYIRSRYKIRVTNVRGARYTGDLGFDDFTLAPACFGRGLPVDEKCPEPETTTPNPGPNNPTTTYIPPDGVVMVTTCGATGPKGPTAEKCQMEYRHNTPPVPAVLSHNSLPGTQTWKVPFDGYYTIVAKGASGGGGVQTQDLTTHGAVARGTFYLPSNTDLYILVGQEGRSACKDTQNQSAEHQKICSQRKSPPDLSKVETMPNMDMLRWFMEIPSNGGGGGGGGASFVFMTEENQPKPLVVAGGGAGLAWSRSEVTHRQSGRSVNNSLPESHGHAFYSSVPFGAGPGGGWKGNHKNDQEGLSLVNGGLGGRPCGENSNSWSTYGGFGGGGGGCLAGGGGGGYTGGNAYSDPDHHGEGGYSFVSGDFPQVTVGIHKGPGVVFIIPAVMRECGCDYICVPLDEHLKERQCICDNGWDLADNGLSCVSGPVGPIPQTIYLITIIIGIFLVVLISTTSICCYNRYQKKKFNLMRREMFSRDPSSELTRLRETGFVTEYNPNYEFGGGTCTVKDLKEIPRENLTLVKALGQGAFGEVYQGYLKNYAGDSVEMPVAVKTLPEMSSNQAEMDFLMEALIMSKFAHPNIVHFIGVCFDKLPRFIVLELLSGGDLKSFLREARPKPDRPSALTMRDLLTCATDVAKGCEYLEENHFIHRDIAARNCLLTTKGPGRVVKIADFGMARDIYRNDYYRKGGKAMLPVKWMPPEAFLDGIFTSKTDVWSFGVLLWEVMSLGYMPYPGRGNQEVMQLVTNGGRLEPPTNCPGPVYRIMTQCWHPIPDERPTFTTILERLGYCIQDPDVVSHALPVFQRPPSAERDATVMRPLDNDACLTVTRRSDEPQSPASTDYLIPLPSSYSLSTVRSELNSTTSLDSGTDCCQMERLLESAAPPPPPPTWETSFTNDPPPCRLPRPRQASAPAQRHTERHNGLTHALAHALKDGRVTVHAAVAQVFTSRLPSHTRDARTTDATRRAARTQSHDTHSVHRPY